MSIINTIGIVACILSAIHAAISFPQIVKTANSLQYNGKRGNINILSGLLMYGCWLTYALLWKNYLLAFVQVLGLFKYIILLIQPVINRNRKS